MMTALPEIDRVPSVAEVDRIAALTDPVIRNLQITQCYHELAAAMTVRTGIQANWCTFATWASKQAGQTIRKEDLARTLENLLRAAPSAQSLPDAAEATRAFGSPLPEDEIQETLAEVLNPLAAFDRASDAVGRGNKKVYEEIARVFAGFCAVCLHDAAFDSAQITQFCDQLRPGDPPDGQGYLRQAFASYYRALFETNPKTQSELLLFANIEIGFHEQTRLQPEILEAMDAAFVDQQVFRLRVVKALFPNRGWMARVRLFLLRLFRRPSPFDKVLDALVIEARRRAHQLITEYMVTISFPGILLRLGDDVPGEFPASLQQITLPDLCALLDQIDATPDSTRDTGAVDWSHLSDRLHYIADLFRCYHDSPTLFDPPFTAAQVAALKAGRLPKGLL